MATFSVQYSFVANTKARAAEVNTNFTNVLTILAAHHHDPNIYTGASPITNSGIAANAKILDTQLNTPITRSGLINPSSLIPVTTPKGGTGHAGYALGELLVGKADGTLKRLAPGTSGQVPTVQGSGDLAYTTISVSKFGGSGVDGALSISSGTTNIDLGGSQIVVKNYTSISITGTGKLTFSNPHPNGTIIIIKSQGGVTLTSSTIPNIDASGMGAAGGSGGTAPSDGSTGNIGTAVFDGLLHAGGGGVGGGLGAGGVAGVALTDTTFYTITPYSVYRKSIFIACGSGGGGGGGTQNIGTPSNGKAGGFGGGALYIECGGALNFTSTLGISVAGKNGGTSTNGEGAGGGGAGGMVVILYNTLTSASGTVNTAGGNGGDATGNNTTVNGGGAGGGGAGSPYGAGGVGGTGGNNSNAAGNGVAAAGAGAGGGGGGGKVASFGATTTGGSGGASTNTLIASNTEFT